MMRVKMKRHRDVTTAAVRSTSTRSVWDLHKANGLSVIHQIAHSVLSSTTSHLLSRQCLLTPLPILPSRGMSCSIFFMEHLEIYYFA